MRSYIAALRHPFLTIRLARRFRRTFGVSLFALIAVALFLTLTEARGLC